MLGLDSRLVCHRYISFFAITLILLNKKQQHFQYKSDESCKMTIEVKETA